MVFERVPHNDEPIPVEPLPHFFRHLPLSLLVEKPRFHLNVRFITTWAGLNE